MKISIELRPVKPQASALDFNLFQVGRAGTREALRACSGKHKGAPVTQLHMYPTLHVFGGNGQWRALAQTLACSQAFCKLISGDFKVHGVGSKRRKAP